jgi:hypothetical protein
MGKGAIAAALLIVLACTSLCAAATNEQIKSAIEKAKTYLYAQQTSDHTWEVIDDVHGNQKTGMTALAVYALLSAGESRQDPRIAPAIAYLKKTDTTGVYALGVRCQLWLMLPPTPDVRAAMTKDAGILLKSLKRSGDGVGFYDYNTGGKNYSHSRAQYAVLGLWAAAQSGIEVPAEYWKFVEKKWIADQDSSGGWAYYSKPSSTYPITPGMTAVGVATLFVTGDYTNQPTRNPAIDRGMQWLADNFSKMASDEEYKRDYPLNTLYAVERTGVASGQKYFGTIDWYAKGADYIVRNQRKDGSFLTEHSGFKPATACFAMLFLARGSSPLVMNKLDYSAATASGADKTPKWNQRSRDAANISRWIGRQVERELHWQVVTLDSPLADLLEAQILYLAGNQELSFKPEHEAKLKSYIEQGGMIVGNADLASSNFSKSFQALGKRMFSKYEFAPLPESHVIYTNQQFRRSDWKRKSNVLSMSNGVRELMIVIPDVDPSRAWQELKPTMRPEAFELAADVFLYSVDKQNLRRRGESYLVTADEKIKATKTIKLARVQYAGNCDPEPAGWPRLAAILHNTRKVELQVEPVKVEELTGQKLAHLTGTAKVTFDAAQRQAIRNFLDAGGTLIIDAAGGATAFAESIEAELAAIVPDAKAQLAEPLAASHPMYAKLDAVGYRNFARSKLGVLKSPQLRGIKIKDRVAVIYSKEDLSGGLVGQPVDGIVGYEPATAGELMSRIILYASGK